MIQARQRTRYSELHTLVRVSFQLRLLALLASMWGFVEQRLSWPAAVAVIVVMSTSIAGLTIPSVPDLLRRHPLLVVLDALVMTAVMAGLGTDNPLTLLALSSCVIIGVLLRPLAAWLAATVLVSGYLVGTLVSAHTTHNFNGVVGTPITFVSFVAMAQAYRIVTERKRASEQANADLITTSATAQERARVARELHDSTAKTLQGLAMTAGAMEHWIRRDPDRAVADARDLAEAAEHEVVRLRGLLTSLREDDLTQPFSDAVATTARATAEAHGVRAVLDLEPVEVDAPSVRAELLAALKEAVTNAATHSGADRVRVSMTAGGGEELTVTVADGGRGFAPETLAASEARGHYGVRGFTERLQLIGGTASVTSTPGGGTVVELSAPVRGLREEPVWQTS